MLEEKDFVQIRDYVIRILPELLRQEPEIAATIEGILAEHFPRRDEFARMLDELAKLREDTNRQFEQVDRRFDLLREEMDRRFEQVDRRFDLLREEMDRRFEQVDRRFEQVDRRFDLLREEMNQRFDQMHKEQLEIKQDVSQLRSAQESFLKRLDAQDRWLQLASGRLGEEKGRTLEDMFAVAFRYGLKNPNITPENIRLRQNLVDQTGECFPAGFKTEVDLIADNDQLTVFEIKATAKRSDVSFFSLKVKLVASQNPDKQVRGVFISLGASTDIRDLCDEYGVELLTGLE